MRAMLPLFLTVPLLAQVPAKVGAEFFERDRKAVMLDCVKAARYLEPEHSRMLAKYGQVYLTAGDRRSAEDAFALAIKSDPKDSTTRMLIGLAWVRAGYKAEALEAFRQIPAGQEDDLAAAARFLVEGGQTAEGEEFMGKAWSLDPKDSENCLAFAKTALSCGYLELAGRWFKRATEASPKDWEVWNSISLAYAEFLSRQQAKRESTPSK